MPKEKSSHSHVPHTVRSYEYKPYSNRGKGSAAFSDDGLLKGNLASSNEWEGVICPVCMETPHNAVLLQCSSFEKGCRPYICDSSYRHSNCFDQYLKAHLACQKICSDSYGSIRPGLEDNVDSLRGGLSSEANTIEPGAFEDASGGRSSQAQEGSSQRVSSLRHGDLLGLMCPLCRGRVQRCEVVKAARVFLDRKVRVCAREACSFAGSYAELRAHARKEHPTARPAEIDPVRQRTWRQLERQRELGDVLSVIQSAMPHATVSGDYAIDGEASYVDNVDSNILFEEGHLLTFILFQVFGPVHSFIGGRLRPSSRGVSRGHRRSGSSRHGLWGEILQQSQNTEVSGTTDNVDFEELDRSHRRHLRRSSS